MPATRMRATALILLAGLVLAGCQSGGGMGDWFSSQPPPPAAPAYRPSIAPSDIVGRWGIAAYHRDQDRPRTEAQARNQCSRPYLISSGSAGGVMMLNHDSPNIIEHMIKASAEGKTFVGPGAEAGGPDDREVISFDGRVLVFKWVDPEVAGRYGFMVLVRCGAEGTAPRAAAPPPASRVAPQPR